jgi:hypothetical protein
MRTKLEVDKCYVNTYFGDVIKVLSFHPIIHGGSVRIQTKEGNKFLYRFIPQINSGEWVEITKHKYIEKVYNNRDFINPPKTKPKKQNKRFTKHTNTNIKEAKELMSHFNSI